MTINEFNFRQGDPCPLFILKAETYPSSQISSPHQWGSHYDNQSGLLSHIDQPTGAISENKETK